MEKRKIKITLYHLPKMSLNLIYAGMHWQKRKAVKDRFKRIIEAQIKWKQDKPCRVLYSFEFEKRPLDASNTVFMGKMIEDVIFPDDNYKMVDRVCYESKKGLTDKLTIYIDEL